MPEYYEYESDDPFFNPLDHIIKMDPAYVERRVEVLKKVSYDELLAEVVNRPSDTNVALVRLVADMLLAPRPPTGP